MRTAGTKHLEKQGVNALMKREGHKRRRRNAGKQEGNSPNSSGNGRGQLARGAAKKKGHSPKRPRQQHRIRRPADGLQERGILKRMYVTDFVHAIQHTRILGTVAPHVR